MERILRKVLSLFCMVFRSRTKAYYVPLLKHSSCSNSASNTVRENQGHVSRNTYYYCWNLQQDIPTISHMCTHFSLLPFTPVQKQAAHKFTSNFFLVHSPTYSEEENTPNINTSQVSKKKREKMGGTNSIDPAIQKKILSFHYLQFLKNPYIEKHPALLAPIHFHLFHTYTIQQNTNALCLLHLFHFSSTISPPSFCRM